MLSILVFTLPFPAGVISGSILSGWATFLAEVSIRNKKGRRIYFFMNLSFSTQSYDKRRRMPASRIQNQSPVLFVSLLTT
jgi:hypothetical protein